jgi:transaldolase
VASAEAYLRGIERRLQAGRSPRVASVASLFVSRWDKAVADKVPPELRNKLGIAVAQKTYRAYRDLLASERWKTLERQGARPQRLLWASTSTKDPSAPDTLYASALAAPDTIDTMPDKTLVAFSDHGRIDSALDDDGSAMLRRFADAGIDVDALARRLQEEGADAFTKSWHHLLEGIEAKTASLQAAHG